MSGRNLDTPTPITREHKRFQTAKRRHDNKSLVRFTEETFNADTDPITEISASDDKHGLQESSKEGKKHKRKKNKSKKRKSKNKVSQQEDGGSTSQLWDLTYIPVPASPTIDITDPVMMAQY